MTDKNTIPVYASGRCKTRGRHRALGGEERARSWPVCVHIPQLL